MELSKIIDKVIAVIPNPDRWMQGDRHGKDEWDEPTHCVLGAIDVVQREGGIAKGQRLTLSNLLRSCVPEGYRGSVIAFNDNYETTYQDIRAFLDRAKEKAEAREIVDRVAPLPQA